jgi:hypothetical protein
MSTSTHTETDTEPRAHADVSAGEHLATQTKDELGRVVSHPVDELKRLEQVAAEGRSASTPLLLVLAVGGFLALIVGLVIAVTLTVYYGT